MKAGTRNTNLPNSNADPQLQNSQSDTLTEMTEQEMSQHLSLCLKLAAENKINTKNAFGLHLIGILRHRIKQSEPDLQFASLSLQASSKIYAGRVEALYKDTFAFHNHLQTIISNKKVTEERDQTDDVDCADVDEDRQEKRKTSKTKQNYLATEENVAFKSETNYTNLIPHANFISIKSAFTAARTAPKLLESIMLGNDSNKMCCTKAVSCFMKQIPVPVCEFSYPDKRKELIKKVLLLKSDTLNFDSNVTSSDVFFEGPQMSPNAAPEPDLNSDDSFCIGTTPVRKEPDDVHEIIERFSVLDITANLFTNDLSLAIVDANTVDGELLPPNSALKRVLKTAEKSRLNKTPLVKTQKEKAPKEPFFNRQRVVHKSILKKGRRIELTDNEIGEWNLKVTTELHSDGHDKFSTVLTDHFDDNSITNNKKDDALRITYTLIEEKILPFNYSREFCKTLQLWNQHRQQTNIRLVRPSSFGVCLRNEDNSKDLLMSPDANSNCIIQSLQNLSIHNCHGDSDDDFLCVAPDADNMSDIFSPERPVITRMSRVSGGFFDDDLKSVMVTPPELVQPVNMKFQTEPITLNTEKVKDALWSVIEKNEETLLSDLHKTLKNVFCKEKLPLQFVFAMLLLLANEKCLLLENVSNGADVKIKKDISEID